MTATISHFRDNWSFWLAINTFYSSHVDYSNYFLSGLSSRDFCQLLLGFFRFFIPVKIICPTIKRSFMILTLTPCWTFLCQLIDITMFGIEKYKWNFSPCILGQIHPTWSKTAVKFILTSWSRQNVNFKVLFRTKLVSDQKILNRINEYCMKELITQRCRWNLLNRGVTQLLKAKLQ